MEEKLLQKTKTSHRVLMKHSADEVKNQWLNKTAMMLNGRKSKSNLKDLMT